MKYDRGKSLVCSSSCTWHFSVLILNIMGKTWRPCTIGSKKSYNILIYSNSTFIIWNFVEHIQFSQSFLVENWVVFTILIQFYDLDIKLVMNLCTTILKLRQLEQRFHKTIFSKFAAHPANEILQTLFFFVKTTVLYSWLV